jgi:signal transduction histidine kinase
VIVEVADDGCGIPADLLPRIFDPFFTTKPVGEGTGLGLSISHGIVVDHGGRIEVESTPGQGSRFRVILPVRGKGRGR